MWEPDLAGCRFATLPCRIGVRFLKKGETAAKPHPNREEVKGYIPAGTKILRREEE